MNYLKSKDYNNEINLKRNFFNLGYTNCLIILMTMNVYLFDLPSDASVRRETPSDCCFEGA